MKTAFKILLSAAIVLTSFAFASCTEETKTIEVVPNDLSNQILTNFDFPAMYNVQQGELSYEFAMNEDYYSDFSAYTTEEPYGIERIFFGIVKDTADVDTAKAELESYFQMIKDQSENYDPVEFAKAEDASVYSEGNFICLVICEDSANALNEVKEIINK